MHILIGGGNGFIGKHVASYLRERGHMVTTVSRFSHHPNSITWQQLHWNQAPKDIQVVINLAGNRFMEWNTFLDSNHFASSSSIEKVETSRLTTAQICTNFAKEREDSMAPLYLYIQCSSYWYYHVNENTENTVWTENDKGGFQDYISRMTRSWENVSKLPDDSQTRKVIIRTGNVLSPEDGLLRNYLIRFKLFLGGPLRKSGMNPLNWVHIQDHCELIEYAITNKEVEGVLNSVAPELVSHSELAFLLSKKLGRPNWISPPRLLLHQMYGPERTKLLVESSWIAPERTLQSGYHFKFINLNSALDDLLKKIPKYFLLRSLFNNFIRLSGRCSCNYNQVPYSGPCIFFY